MHNCCPPGLSNPPRPRLRASSAAASGCQGCVRCISDAPTVDETNFSNFARRDGLFSWHTNRHGIAQGRIRNTPWEKPVVFHRRPSYQMTFGPGWIEMDEECNRWKGRTEVVKSVSEQSLRFSRYLTLQTQPGSFTSGAKLYPQVSSKRIFLFLTEFLQIFWELAMERRLEVSIPDSENTHVHKGLIFIVIH